MAVSGSSSTSEAVGETGSTSSAFPSSRSLVGAPVIGPSSPRPPSGCQSQPRRFTSRRLYSCRAASSRFLISADSSNPSTSATFKASCIARWSRVGAIFGVAKSRGCSRASTRSMAGYLAYHSTQTSCLEMTRMRVNVFAPLKTNVMDQKKSLIIW
jgi:hypothetical protein